MEMKRCLGASILLVLWLEAALLVAGHPFVDRVATIRLPSSDNEVTKPARPWKCCDNAAPCTRSMPPTCQCADEVEECSPTCKVCVESTLHPSLFVCKDRYFGDPGPICKPWECCDAAICTKSIPPICRCVDEVDQCAATCKSCVASTSDPYRYVCEDTYRGFPGRMCNPDN